MRTRRTKDNLKKKNGRRGTECDGGISDKEKRKYRKSVTQKERQKRW